MPSKSPKKVPASPLKNPYSSSQPIRADVTGTIDEEPRFNGQKVDIAETKAHKIFVSWATKPFSEAGSYMNPVSRVLKDPETKDAFANKFGIHMQSFRRDFNRPEENEKLPSSVDSQYHWEAFVTVGKKDDTTLSVASRVIAGFNDCFGNEQSGSNRFKLRRVVSDTDDLRPLTYYVLDHTAMKVFKKVYAQSNTKETMLECDDILEAFFGSAEHGRSLLDAEESWAN
jgi:hypothetical protein